MLTDLLPQIHMFNPLFHACTLVNKIPTCVLYVKLISIHIQINHNTYEISLAAPLFPLEYLTLLTPTTATPFTYGRCSTS